MEEPLLNEDVTFVNLILGYFFEENLKMHHLRIKNATDDALRNSYTKKEIEGENIVYTLNCDPETADKDYLTKITKSDSDIQEAFQTHISHLSNPPTFLQKVAYVDMLNTLLLIPCNTGDKDLRSAQSDNFDLKVNALGRWGE